MENSNPSSSRPAPAVFQLSLTSLASSASGVISRFGETTRAALAQIYLDSKHAGVSWGKLLFVTTVLATMVGCGLLSAIRSRKRVQGQQQQRTSYRKSSEVSATVSSSEDEDIDSSNGSLARKKALARAKAFISRYKGLSPSGESEADSMGFW